MKEEALQIFIDTLKKTGDTFEEMTEILKNRRPPLDPTPKETT